jgi:hypothetical protein
VKIVILLLATAIGSIGCSDADREAVAETYYAQLDSWVEAGGQVNTIQANVVEPCGKLFLSYSSPSDVLLYTTTAQKEFDFYVDLCVKLTAHRIGTQPEFETASEELIETTCNSHETWRRLCDKAKLDI